MTGNKYLIFTTTEFFYMAECLRYSRGSIFNISRILGFGAQAIIHRYYSKASIHQFLWNMLTATFQSTTMKPYNGREIFFVHRIVDIQFTTFFSIGISFLTGNIRKVFIRFLHSLCMQGKYTE